MVWTITVVYNGDHVLTEVCSNEALANKRVEELTKTYTYVHLEEVEIDNESETV